MNEINGIPGSLNPEGKEKTLLDWYAVTVQRGHRGAGNTPTEDTVYVQASIVVRVSRIKHFDFQETLTRYFNSL